MYKVLLAEDELLVRIGLKNSVNWAEFDMEIVAEEESGTGAYRKYLQVKPDLILTDIRMPGMSGLELIRKVRETDRHCAVIVISCMDDFKILQDIMRCDVTGYILKASMSIQEVEELLERARQRLELTSCGGPSETRVPRSEEELLRAYVEGSMPEDEFVREWTADARLLPQYVSLTVFRVLPLHADSLNAMGISFITSVIRENLPDSVVWWMGDCLAALHKEQIVCTDSRFGRISQMIQTILEGSFSQITQGLSGELSSLSSEVRGLLDICRGRLQLFDHTIYRAVDYILNHYCENLTLASIAGYVGLSPNYFSTLFRKETGVTLVTYLNDIRIEKAKQLLANTDEYLYVIAEETGFNTVEHFSQTFKQKEGMNPGDWRKNRGCRRKPGGEQHG